MPRGPDFICIGLQKAGTRWLYDQMAAADGVWMPPVKELNYFSGNTFKPGNLATVANHSSTSAEGGAEFEADRRFLATFKRGQIDGTSLDWYVELFEPKGSRLSGDVSPTYATMEPREIAATVRSCPDSKYVLLLRDPVSRFWSAACMGVRKGMIPEQDLMRWSSVSHLLAKPVFQKQSFPTRVWRKWSAVLPSNSLRFWFLDDIATTPDPVRQDICRFVGLPSMQSSLPPSFNRKGTKKTFEMPAEVRRRLAIYFDAEICEAAEVFGGPAVAWKEKNRALVGDTQRWWRKW